jgi:hypothetical protein
MKAEPEGRDRHSASRDNGRQAGWLHTEPALYFPVREHRRCTSGDRKVVSDFCPPGYSSDISKGDKSPLQVEL